MLGKKVVLIILDGWGLSPSWGGNALAMNSPRNIDGLWRDYPHKILQALGAVEYGNIVGESRLGHLMLGAGRPVRSYHGLISADIKTKTFYKNPVLNEAFDHALKNNLNIHLVGMISNGGVHSDYEHLIALLDLAHRKNFKRVFIDAITDGIDSASTESLKFIEKINDKIKDVDLGEFSSVSGRFYAMDRDGNWDRIQKYYDTVKLSKGVVYNQIEEAVSANYRNNLTDDKIPPCLIKDKTGHLNPIKENDVIIMFNFREDRMIELTHFLITGGRQEKANKLKDPKNLIVTFTKYGNDLPVQIVYPNVKYPNNLSEYLSGLNYKQLKIAESEKYSHVTSFFNGGEDVLYKGEERIIIPSVRVESFNQRPEMSAKKITAATIKAINQNKYELIVINFANVDMVAHTGDITATGIAVQIVDEMVGKIVQANLDKGGITIISADHGNAEQMLNLTNQFTRARETEHTLNPVPFILVSPNNKKDLLRTSVSFGPNTLAKIITARESLSDVAPTILEIFGLPKPAEMTGRSLINSLE